MILLLLIRDGGGGEKVIVGGIGDGGGPPGDEDHDSGVDGVDGGDAQVDVNLGGVQEDDPGVAVDELVHVRRLGNLDLCLHVEPKLCCQCCHQYRQHFGHCGLVYAFVITIILFNMLLGVVVRTIFSLFSFRGIHSL